MGYSVGAFCDCGYRRYGLLIGYGMKPRGVLLPVLCKRCKTIFSGCVNDLPVPCPSCKKPCKTHVSEKGWRVRLGRTKYTCPVCGEKALRFGNFDVRSQIDFCHWD
jgi:hypothetical protein